MTRISALPALLLLVGGLELARAEGARPRESSSPGTVRASAVGLFTGRAPPAADRPGPGAGVEGGAA
jgi:hypothetical protein